MLGSIVVEMAALTKSREIARGVVREIVVQVGTGDGDLRPPVAEPFSQAGRIGEVCPKASSLPIAPAFGVFIEPAAVIEHAYEPPMRTITGLTPAFGAAEADGMRKLMPVGRVEALQFRLDRHNSNVPSLRPSAWL